MIKQRYIRHQAINKQGEVVAIGYEVAKQIYPFGKDVTLANLHTESTVQFLATFWHVGSVQKWKDWLRRKDASVRLTKAIVYVG